MSLSRRRLSAQESRAAALEAARTLLLKEGPQAVTLKAVATLINRTHANLLHHFGSAAGLQIALANHLATRICDDIAKATRLKPLGSGDLRRMVDLVFDMFGSGGGGALAAWMLCTGHKGALDPILEAVYDLVDTCLPVNSDAEEVIKRRELTYSLVLMALGKALIGDQLAGSLAVDRSSARRHGEDMIANARARVGVS